jgi:hypothetical protein
MINAEPDVMAQVRLSLGVGLVSDLRLDRRVHRAVPATTSIDQQQQYCSAGLPMLLQKALLGYS